MKSVVKTAIVLVIGGTVYTASQADIVDNFSKDTGLTQQKAEQYVSEIKEEDLVPFGEIGSNYISEGQDMISLAVEIDCVNYYYEWESPTLTCDEGKSQLKRVGNSEIALGRAYRALDTEEASSSEISSVIRNIDRLNADYGLDIVTLILDPITIDDVKKTNSYNKALLQAALDSN